MRKIRITESQLKTILESIGYPLNVDDANEEPDNFMGNEVAVNNVDPDAPDDVTTTDNVAKKRSRKGWFGIYGYKSPMSHFTVRESENLDNRQNSGYGQKSDAFIQSTAENGGGKMVNNLNAEVKSNKRGSRNNTNQVRIHRMEKAKTEDPVTFAKNGGEKTLNILKTQTKKTSCTFSDEKTETTITQPSAGNGGEKKAKKKTQQTVYYFE